jgi:hypothetical protein
MARKKVATSGGSDNLKAPTNYGNEDMSPDPRKEYLVGGVLSRNIGIKVGPNLGGSTLNSTNDDLMKDFGYQIYDQMAKDPKIAKCLKLLKVSVLGDGVNFIPCKSDNDPEYDNAKMVSDFCTYAVRNMKKPLKVALEQMLDAIKYGHKIAEIVYKNEFIDELNGTYLTIDSIKPKPIGVARFVVDDSFNVLGITGNNKANREGRTLEKENNEAIPAKNITSKNGKIFVKTADGVENEFIGIDKFMILTLDTEDEDPRGRSSLRAAFNFWHLKNQVIPEYLRYLLTCSIPLLIGFTPEDQEGQAPHLLRDSAGNIQRDSNGKPIAINREEAMRDALMQARNATTLALKGGSKVQEVGANGSGIPFYKAIEVFDSQIEMSILLQTLASSDSKFNTRAASETHMSVLEQLVWSLKEQIADMLTHYLLKPLIKYNFGKEYLKYLPIVGLGDSERRNFVADAQAIASLYAAGYLSEDQKRACDQLLQLPVRDSNYDQFRNITPEEAMRYSEAVLNQAKQEAEVKKTRESANLEKINQVVGLQKALESEAVDASVRAAMNEHIIKVLESIELDNIDTDEARITQTFINAGVRAKAVLTPENLKLGSTTRTDYPTSAASNLKQPIPSSGSTVGNNPYISVKAKPATFSNKVKSVFRKIYYGV